ncbi:hypothetical protein H0I29_17190 [Polaribacter sp. R2A056_3_33]|uniref:hypothetical protein n=1 Tax=Polaribacter sp. R2A056_3_33 TaxID=2745563 RepID=UPI001C4E30BE|nr:hypothetical protein [Polaribacter sp. R2A056_3_33]QXP70327.1 hypothetical protein H0I29_17190 [Polaribacter sp. R2A056_3_33]
MKFSHKIRLFLFLLTNTFLFGQTPGFNYQALILNNEEIQIPGTNVLENKVPLGLEEIILRFTISNETSVEYIEEHTISTDKNGMVSLIVGEGIPISNTFYDINWDGKLKYLNVELNILNDNDGFVFLDSQKILYRPQPDRGNENRNGNIKIVSSLGDLSPPYQLGDIIWLTDYGINNSPSLMIWDDIKWTPINNDFDPTNEFGLIVVGNDSFRDAQFKKPVTGDQVWNQTCNCLEVYDGTQWVSLRNMKAENGLYTRDNKIKLGGILIEPTLITTSATNTFAFAGLQESTNTEDQIVVMDKSTGVLRQKPNSTLHQKKQVIIIASDGQLEFTTPLKITNSDKIDVFRNGVRINFIAINNTTIKLEQEAKCYQDDKVRIVQLY